MENKNGNSSSSPDNDSVFDDLSTITDVSMTYDYSIPRSYDIEYQNMIDAIDEYSDYSSDYSTDYSTDYYKNSFKKKGNKLLIPIDEYSDYSSSIERENKPYYEGLEQIYKYNSSASASPSSFNSIDDDRSEEKEKLIKDSVKNHKTNNIQNIDTMFYFKPFNYLFYKLSVLFGNLFMFFSDWRTVFRTNNDYYIPNYVDSIDYKNFEEFNYYNLDGLKSLNEEKMYIVKYNNSNNSLFEKVMLLSFLWKNKLSYQIMLDKSKFKWYNKKLLKYLGFVSVEEDYCNNSYYYPLNYYFDYVNNNTKKTLLIFDLTNINDYDNSYFFMSKYAKCPVLILGLDYFNQKIVIDGYIELNNDLKNTNKLVYNRLSYYPPIINNDKLNNLTNDFENSYVYRSENLIKMNMLNKFFYTLKYNSVIGNNFKSRIGFNLRFLILFMPFIYMFFNSCYFHYFYKLVLAKKFFIISYIDHTLYFFKHCMI